MVIRHMVLFSFRIETDPITRQTVLAMLAQLPDHFPAIEHFGLGANKSERDTTFSHVMTMEFASFDLLHDYLNSDRHEVLVRDWFAPNVVARAIASYQTA